MCNQLGLMVVFEYFLHLNILLESPRLKYDTRKGHMTFHACVPFEQLVQYVHHKGW